MPVLRARTPADEGTAATIAALPVPLTVAVPAAPVTAVPSQAAPAPGVAETLGMALLRDGLISAEDMVQALSLQSSRGGRLGDILVSRRLVAPLPLSQALARHWKTQLVDPVAEEPDVRLIDGLGSNYCLRHSLLPLRSVGGVTLIATAQPEDFDRNRAHLTDTFGPIAMAIAPLPSLEAAILRLRGPSLARAAESRVADAESCRHLTGAGLLRMGALGLFMLCTVALIWPVAVGWAIAGWAALTMLLATALKAAAGISATLAPRPESPAAAIVRLPVVSIMVALYRESDIAPRLVRRLGLLDYPRELLDIVLVVEEEDMVTRNAIDTADLPPWMRVVVAPKGRVKTKPRALNFALDHCRGSIIGVYDAEDAPEPDQITRIVQRFYQRGPDVACLQGVLDFYNPTTNWLSRCFTIEYATWFRLVLPGLERLGLPIPLGGTTLFFRRAALESLGGWDAHNVTEDADLGIRLYRHGYRTELVKTTTYEEANCRALPWVKQRSRWLKGYMMTWAAHMRDPALLWRDLGAWRFAGFQVLFLCTLSQFLLMPVIWSFWLSWFGIWHPVTSTLSQGTAYGLVAVFLLTEAVNLTLGLRALHLSGHRFSRWWVPTLSLYFPLGALASYKAAWEMVRKPFYWDKTMHGKFDPLDP
jgi:cellulose synthase/poly-beta-1,6-N-acetylglucosamine synthase-like glycosyltransferase